MPTISPARTLERDAPHLLDPAVVERRAGPRPSSSASPGFAGGFSTRSSTSRADHRARERLLGRAGARHRLDLLAAAQHGRPVADLEHLVELVADEDDRLAVGLEALDDREQLGRLLRRQHGRRLVEDQDLGAAVERLQDLDALLLADGDLRDRAPSARPRARTAARARARAPPRRARRACTPSRVGSMPSTMFSATVITGISMKCWCTIPIPARDRVLRRAERDRLAR